MGVDAESAVGLLGLLLFIDLMRVFARPQWENFKFFLALKYVIL